MIKLFCDMGADIPKKLIEKYDISLFTMMISDGKNEYVLGKDIDKYKLFDQMKKGINFHTSQVAYSDYYNAFKEAVSLGEEVIYISLSSGISGTYNTAIMAKNAILEEFKDAKIYIFDSFGATFGYGFVVLKVAKMLENNESIEEIIKLIDFHKKHGQFLFSAGDLTYLYRGGRLSKTKFFIGNLLNILPIMDVSKVDGTLEMIDKARGHKALKKKILEHIKQKADNFKDQTILFLQGDCLEKAVEFKEFLSKELQNDDIIISDIDAVIGCHTGPDIITVFYLDKLYGKYDKIKL